MLGFAPIATVPVAASFPKTAIAFTEGASPGQFAVTGRGAQITSAVGGYLTRPNWLAVQDFLGASAASQVTSRAEVNIGQPDGFGGVIWGGWQKFNPGNYVGQFAWFRFFVQVPTNQTVGELLQATAQSSVPSRIDNYLNVSLPSDGLTLVFQPAGSSVPAPFNKGPTTAAFPGGEPLPAVQVTWNNQPGDQLVLSDLTLASVTIQILNGGAGVARTLQTVQVQGF